MTERREETLILKRNSDAAYSESYNVLFEGRHVGRIYCAMVFGLHLYNNGQARRGAAPDRNCHALK